MGDLKEFNLLIYGFVDNEDKIIIAESIEEALGKVFSKLKKINNEDYSIENGVFINVSNKGRKPNCYVVDIRVKMSSLYYLEDENDYNLVLRKDFSYKKFKVHHIDEFNDYFPVVPLLDFVKKEMPAGNVSVLNSVNGVRPLIIDYNKLYSIFVKDGVLFII